ncbi:MAG: PAS/PAC sensor hybrid histidine kinase [Gammaproteobacteria bacterium]|nr:MAG: PAS/PAC sensor hybrid histidine kinase [Gammaproteobacteria bacterium]TND02122.1 MAG: PAS/PAC sensor hybrid histidine kinase [Gammaproteobacteria bacterium]
MKILIVEDDPDLQALHGRRVASRGHVYDLARNGREAVDYAWRNRGDYDVCLMDIEMPVMNGLEAAAIIRRQGTYLPILACSSNPAYRVACAKIGIDDFLVKPFSKKALFARLGALVIKWLKLQVDHDNLRITEERPVDRQHAQELRELAKKDLRKVIIYDNPGKALIVHKNVLNKISHDFNVKRQVITTFVNRDPEKPTVCQLYRQSNYLMPQMFITEEEYGALVEAENRELDSYEGLSFKVCEDGPSG